MLKVRNNWHSKWSAKLKHNAEIIKALENDIYIGDYNGEDELKRIREAITKISDENQRIKKQIKASERAFGKIVAYRPIVGGNRWRAQVKWNIKEFEDVMTNSVEFNKYMVS